MDASSFNTLGELLAAFEIHGHCTACDHDWLKSSRNLLIAYGANHAAAAILNSLTCPRCGATNSAFALEPNHKPVAEK